MRKNEQYSPDPPMVMSNKCGNCRFSFVEEGAHWCRRFPRAWDSRYEEWTFPGVFEDDWCGEWSFRTAEDEYDRMSEEDRVFLAQAHRTRYYGQATDATLDRIYALADEAMTAGRFEILDYFLNDIPVGATPTDCLIGWLTATLPAKSKLPSRSGLLGAVRLVLHGRSLNEDVEKLLEGLE